MTQNHLGKSIFVSAANPATNDAAGFEALTWTEVAGLQQLPQFGVTHAGIDVPDLKSGFTGAIKGAASGKDSQMIFRTVASDAGAAILLAQANDNTGELSVKVVTGSGTNNAPVTGDPVQYAQGYCHSHEENQGTDSTHEGFTVSLKQNDFTIKATEPV